MSQTNYYIQQGQVITKTTGTTKGLFSLTKFFKTMATRFHVAYVDDCCPDQVDTTAYPIRYNHDTSKIQYYNAATAAWVNLSSF